MRSRTAKGVLVICSLIAVGGALLWTRRSNEADVPDTTSLGSFSSIRQRRYSPDGGSYFVIGSNELQDLGLLAVDFGGGLQVVDLNGIASTAAWTPDGERVVVEVLFGDTLQTKLVRVDSTGERPVELVVLAEGLHGDFGMDVNPDGESVVIGLRSGGSAAPADRYDLDVETGELTQITDTPALNELEPVVLDADHVLFVGSEVSDPVGASALMVLDRRTGTTHKLTPDNMAPQEAAVRSDDQLIAFLAATPPGDFTQPSLWTIRPDGSELALLDQPVAFGPITFAADGRSIEIGVPGMDLSSFPSPDN